MAEVEDQEAWADVSLRLWSEHLTPEEISRALDLEPTAVHGKGEPVSAGYPLSNLRTANAWIYTVGDQFASSPQGSLEVLLQLISTLKAPLSRLLTESHGDIFVGWSPPSQAGLWIEPEHLEVLGKLGLALVFDVYGATAEEADGRTSR